MADKKNKITCPICQAEIDIETRKATCGKETTANSISKLKLKISNLEKGQTQKRRSEDKTEQKRRKDDGGENGERKAKNWDWE